MQAPFVDPFSNVKPLEISLPLVGREGEMQILRALLENAYEPGRAGPHALVLTGESGIGKSRLLEEMCDLAGKRGFILLRGKAYPAGQTFPYLPFIEGLRPLVRSLSNHALQRYLGLHLSPHEVVANRTPENISVVG